ncbi:semaphorin-3G isoform X2 [Petromyzon marinus]|uniref:semaphorin-3G isoform X2 n=1 Tax=Petromyzon marinus TaxID=7757 RepID=UPI003F712077
MVGGGGDGGDDGGDDSHAAGNEPRARVALQIGRAIIVIIVVAVITEIASRAYGRWAARVSALLLLHGRVAARNAACHTQELRGRVVALGGVATHALLRDEERGLLLIATTDSLLLANLNHINRSVRELRWVATEEQMAECRAAGRDPRLDCANFLRVLHAHNESHVLLCGTGAFHPQCLFVDVHALATGGTVQQWRPQDVFPGRGRCSYDPRSPLASAMIGGRLYAGLAADFLGHDGAAFRSLGAAPTVRSEQHDTRWLHDPRFVHVEPISEGRGENEKVYFFFHERATEGETGDGRGIVSRVAQVCKDDEGGRRSLVGRWSTFLKARLVCSVPGVSGVHTHFHVLQDVFVLKRPDGRSPLIFAIFTTSSDVLRGSALCVYNMADVSAVFRGAFAHREGARHAWGPYTGRVPFPRPGTCPGGVHGTYRSTRDLPDAVVDFARAHPLVAGAVRPASGRPALVHARGDRLLTRVVAESVDATDGRYHVLYLGTDTGRLLKAVLVPGADGGDSALLLEELQLFEDGSAVTVMEISSKRRQLYVGSGTGLVQLPVQRCDLYGQACAECCLARDPHCAWDGRACSRYHAPSRRRFRRQDVRHGNPVTQCHGQPVGEAQEERQFVVAGSGALLECRPRSRHARVSWQRQTRVHVQSVTQTERLLLTEHGLLIRDARPSDAGLYACRSEELGFTRSVARLRLAVLPAPRVEAAALPRGGWGGPERGQRRGWYERLLALLSTRPEGPEPHSCEGPRSREGLGVGAHERPREERPRARELKTPWAREGTRDPAAPRIPRSVRCLRRKRQRCPS